MKYIKMLGLAAVAVAALTASVGVGTASATQLTGAGGAVLGVGTEIKAENEGIVILDTPFGGIICSGSAVAGQVTNAGSSTTTVSGAIETLTFSICNATVTVLKKGTFEIHTQSGSANNNGTFTSSGAEVTVQYLGTHCIYRTQDTDLGTLTGSATTGGNATLDISAMIPRTGGTSGAFCGLNPDKTPTPGTLTGAYKLTSPPTLNIH